MKRFTALMVCVMSFVAVGAAVAQDAPALYKTKCAMCHGADGKTPSMIGKNLGSPDLSSAKVQKMSDKELHETLLHGKGKMPAYEKAFGEKNIDLMVKYVRGIK